MANYQNSQQNANLNKGGQSSQQKQGGFNKDTGMGTGQSSNLNEKQKSGTQTTKK